MLASTSGQYWTLVPTFLEYNKPIGDESGPDATERAIAVALGFHEPSNVLDDKSETAGTVIVIGEVAPGAAVKFALPRVKNPDHGVTWDNLEQQGQGFLQSPWFPSFIRAGATPLDTQEKPLTLRLHVDGNA